MSGLVECSFCGRSKPNEQFANVGDAGYACTECLSEVTIRARAEGAAAERERLATDIPKKELKDGGWFKSWAAVKRFEVWLREGGKP
jgi:sarcosine oxidase delta subunit